MSALTLGLIAALCWGFHDICVRFLSQKTPITACIFVVLVAGLVFHLGLMGFAGGIAAPPMQAVWPALLAGVFFVIATFGLYAAFQRGPVRLVAPVIAGYPILSVGLATWQGEATTAAQWLAVLAIVCGVAFVASLSDTSVDASPPKGPTVLYAMIAAIGFAGTFAFGQHAAETSSDLSATFVTRIMAVGLTIAVILMARQPFWPGRRAMPLLVTMGFADGIALYAVLSAGGLQDAQYAAVASSVFGLITILLAWLLLREQMTLPQWGGAALAFAGVGYLAL